MGVAEVEQQHRNFAAYRNKLKRVPVSKNAYTNRYGGLSHDGSIGRMSALDLDDIYKILETGDLTACRQLSYYYYRISGLYRNAILMMANLPLYQTLVNPIFDINKKVSEEAVTKKFAQALKYVDNLEVPINFSRISWSTLLGGIYYGILREDNGHYTLQDLPESYCRTRFKDCHNLNIIEFNLTYFTGINNDTLRAEAVAAYPAVVRKYWRKYLNGELTDTWIPITAADGGCCFMVGDGTPLFLASIPDIYKFEEALKREGVRDENELYKLLIERMPIDSKGELVFELEEVADIHASVADMLKNVETVDVLTTFGEAKLESVQDSSASSQSSERLKKYKDTVYDALGLSELYFNADTSSAMAYASAKDESIMAMFTNQYAKWIEVQVNSRFSKSNLTFSVTILPTTRINRKEIQSQFFQGAQYGYSKMAAGVATGIKQIDMLPTMVFENEYLHMSERMLPLMSTYTMSSKEEKNSTNSQKGDASNNLNNEGGRPTVDDKDRSDQTQANIDSEG